MSELTNQKCQACEAGMMPLTKEQAKIQLSQVNGWYLNDAGTTISRVFHFKGFYKTMAFVNAVAWIANREAHHPDLEVSYNRCVVNFTTHAINGLSNNDFICAAKVDQL